MVVYVRERERRIRREGGSVCVSDVYHASGQKMCLDMKEMCIGEGGGRLGVCVCVCVCVCVFV
jgi:hypothetical protein